MQSELCTAVTRTVIWLFLVVIGLWLITRLRTYNDRLGRLASYAFLVVFLVTLCVLVLSVAPHFISR